MKRPRISRLVQLIGLLQAGRPENADVLARRCKVSRRTIFRDLDLLRTSGVPVLFDDEHGSYRIPSNYYLQPTNFTPDEALAVLLLCFELGSDSRLPFYGAAQSAAIKLEASLPTAQRERHRATAGAVHIQFTPTNRLVGQEPIYRQLMNATMRRLAVRIDYASASEEGPISTRLSSYCLLFIRHSWYVVGRSSLHRDVRTFNIGRIQKLEPLTEAYVVPRRFSIERYLGNAWRMIREPRDEEVVIRFDKLVARNVAEVQWHKTQRAEFLDDGRLEFRVTVAGLNEISWWIMGYGDQAEVISPARLRKLIAERAARLAARYSKDA